MDDSVVASTGHANAPWIAANLAVLNEAAVDVRLDVDFQSLAAKRTGDQELVWHCRQSYCNAARPAMLVHAADVVGHTSTSPPRTLESSAAERMTRTRPRYTPRDTAM